MSKSSLASIYNFKTMHIEHIDIVNKPVKSPGPVTRMNISPYTKGGTVLIAMIITLPIRLIGFGTILVAEINANGTAKIAPTTVPRNAIQTVSRSKYAIHVVVKLNSNSVYG